MVSARQEFNFLFASWSNKTPNLWEVLRAQATLTAGAATYSLPNKTTTILDASIVLNFGTSSESRTYITPISRTEYMTYSNQQVQGRPTTYWYDRLVSQTITFWPVPDSNVYTFDYFTVTQIQDARLPGGETPDVPYRWIDAIVAGLAHRLARIYAAPLEQLRKADADEAWAIAAEQDTEAAPVKISPNIRSYYPH